jgi:putative copper resistance protein D
MVTSLIAAGVYLYSMYIETFAGLVGTAYGTMLLTKVTLMCVALILGGMNFLVIRKWKQTGKKEALFTCVPVLIEAEAGIGIAILMAAAALTGQPPSIDTVAQRASWREVLHSFVPKVPQLTPASISALNANRGGVSDLFSIDTPLDKIQSNFNHNISGIFVILIGLGVCLHRMASIRVARHWPLVFIPFWVFLLVFAQPTGWPLGNKGFWEGLFIADILQHRIGTALVVVLGIVEWRVQNIATVNEKWKYAFPLLCYVGGILLLSHSHSTLPTKAAYLIEVSHNAIGILAVLMGTARWLELRMPDSLKKAPSYLWPTCMILVGVVLLVYQEF